MKKLLFFMLFMVSTMIAGCSNLAEEDLLKKSPTTKSPKDSTSEDSAGLNINIGIDGWDTTHTNVSF